MDKDYKKVKVITAIIGIIFLLVICKFVGHKREINRLLKEDDLVKSDNVNINLSCSKEDSYKKVKKYSEKVKKKETEGKDFISEAEKMNNPSKSGNNDILSGGNIVSFKEDDVRLLARLIYSEAGNEPYLGKLAVGNVVLNRSYENNISIEDVIFAKNQFDGVNTVSFSDEPNEESINAAIEVLSGTQAIEGGYFFANLKLCDPNWAREKTFICRIGDHWFFKKE